MKDFDTLGTLHTRWYTKNIHFLMGFSGLGPSGWPIMDLACISSSLLGENFSSSSVDVLLGRRSIIQSPNSLVDLHLMHMACKLGSIFYSAWK